MFDQFNVAALQVLAAVPNPGRGEAPPGFDKFLTVLKWCAAVSLGMCVLGFLVTAATIAVQHRTGTGMGDHGSRVGAVMAACILIGSASAIVTALT
jgi:hypothetical protein